ncbi:hypothetical protein MKX03_037268 [Papaver bracteatum]|nr:hypothetical protein MKX03_037268 [Papaver bracteatum]
MSCPRCTKAHLMKDGNPWCKSCEKRVKNPVPRYKLHLIVTDNTTQAVIIVSGPAAEPLLDGVKVAKLMEISSIDIKANMAEFVPEIVDTLGRSFIFEVQLNEKSFGYTNFSVRKLCPINYDLETRYELRNIQQVTKSKHKL